MYLNVVLDWYSRKVLAWRLSISMDADLCIEAVEEAVARWGKPEIFNTDQGSQYTSQAFTQMLLGHGIAISMDGKGYWRDNVFVERLWRSVNYEEVYLKAYDCARRHARAWGNTWNSTIEFVRIRHIRRGHPRRCTLNPGQSSSWPHSHPKRTALIRAD